MTLRVDGGLALVGPTSGTCVACAEEARLAVLGPETPRDARLGGMIAPMFRPLIEALGNQDLPDTVIAVRTDLGVVSTHRVHPREHCAPRSADSTAVPNSPVPVQKGALRQPNDLTTVDGLKAALVDLKHGPVIGTFRTGHLPLAMVGAELVRDFVIPEAGYGRTADFEEAERVALFEAVERHNGMRPRKTTIAAEASFAELGHDKALDPERLGLPDAGHSYTPDLRMRWVHGWSYTRNKPLLVPEQVAYWAVQTPHEQRFLYETSNGCGLGNSLTEAVLHGLFEIAERDAFLMAWYARTPLTRIRVPDDPVLPHLVDRLEELGYELLFLDATNDIGIPAVLTLARTSRPGLPQAFFAAGANPNPTAAMRSAAAEVVVDVESMVDRIRAKPEDYRDERLRGLLNAPERIWTMDDHVAVNALPEAQARHAFFVNDHAPIDLTAEPQHTDLRELLDVYRMHLEQLDLELIAVDQSDPVIARKLGLYSAKVIVPGTLPMTFGHLNRRTTGIPRLRAEQPLHPHPFP
ncbi:YcaO-like family protein [Lentzea sp. NPDC051213]|uniref:YcaO-like family protein n=1 Tax=Lentzea sp. NPDC051213 TaxID=3364126 RepID=UPI0037A6B91D